MRIHPGKKNNEVGGGQLVALEPASRPSSDGNVQMMHCMAGILKELLPKEFFRGGTMDDEPRITINAMKTPTAAQRRELSSPPSSTFSLSPTVASLLSSLESAALVCPSGPRTAAATHATAAATAATTHPKRHREAIDDATARALAAMEAKEFVKVKNDKKLKKDKKVKKGKPPKACAKASPKACAKASAGATINHEKSRCQFLVRGLKGGNCLKGIHIW